MLRTYKERFEIGKRNVRKRRELEVEAGGSKPIGGQQCKITDFYFYSKLRNIQGAGEKTRLTPRERELHRLAESNTDPQLRNVFANKIHVEYLRRRSHELI
jgi:hypothetical protein